MFNQLLKQEELNIKAKPFSISKDLVYESWLRVKSNKGGSGIDKVSIENFEKNLKENLYKIWNRMSSGSYFPPPVKLVEIPKKDGGVRTLGIPTVSDRIAQMVCKILIEPRLENTFHKHSYGYRPNKSAIDAVGRTRKMCFYYDWVIDLDIKGFFDNINHELMMKAARRHIKENWILMYIERWLKCPLETNDGERKERTKGTPQGGVISPLLANLFLHYGFDDWMERFYPNVPFERYADDCIIHCRSEAQANHIKSKVEERVKSIKLELHPVKTKIVYCKDEKRKGNYKNTSFDFLGYTFRNRICKIAENVITGSFLPAISKSAVKKIREEIRGLKVTHWVSFDLEEVSKRLNSKIRGWGNYYGKFYKTELRKIFDFLNMKFVKWAMRKYKVFRRNKMKALKWLCKMSEEKKNLFSHWQAGFVLKG